jgi:hypothetical protein
MKYMPTLQAIDVEQFVVCPISGQRRTLLLLQLH